MKLRRCILLLALVFLAARMLDTSWTVDSLKVQPQEGLKAAIEGAKAAIGRVEKIRSETEARIVDLEARVKVGLEQVRARVAGFTALLNESRARVERRLHHLKKAAGDERK